MIGLIVLYAALNYNNAINTTIAMMNRFVDGEPKRNYNKIEDYKLKPEFNIDGLYIVIIQNSVIIHGPENLRNNEIDEFAVKILKRNNEKGVIILTIACSTTVTLVIRNTANNIEAFSKIESYTLESNRPNMPDGGILMML